MCDPNEPDIGPRRVRHGSNDVAEDKRQLRRSMRALRLALPDRPERSRLVVEHLVAIDRVRDAGNVLVYDAVTGEVETAGLIDWCHRRGVAVAMPEDAGLDPAWADVIVVPGTAFTVQGARIGQGGGWYDRFLPGRRPDAFTVGVGFSAQVVDRVPEEDHDVRLDCIVTDRGAVFPDVR